MKEVSVVIGDYYQVVCQNFHHLNHSKLGNILVRALLMEYL